MLPIWTLIRHPAAQPNEPNRNKYTRNIWRSRAWTDRDLDVCRSTESRLHKHSKREPNIPPKTICFIQTLFRDSLSNNSEDWYVGSPKIILRSRWDGLTRARVHEDKNTKPNIFCSNKNYSAQGRTRNHILLFQMKEQEWNHQNSNAREAGVSLGRMTNDLAAWWRGRPPRPPLSL